MKKSVTFNGEIWTLDKVREVISTQDKAALHALMLIYSYQTPDEQTVGFTTDDNGMGFNAFDSDILTSFADSYKKYGSLTPKQMECLKKKIKKYGRQVFDSMVKKHGKTQLETS